MKNIDDTVRVVFAAALAFAMGCSSLDISSATPAADAFQDLPSPDAADLAGSATTSDLGVPSSPDLAIPAVSGSAGCGQAFSSVGYVSGLSMAVASTARTYNRYVPALYDPSRPHKLIFVFHGLNNNGAGIRNSLNFESWPNSQPNESTIIYYPDAIQSGNKAFNVDDGTASNVDLQFFDALVDAAQSSLCVDPKRIFVTGFSQGGYMTNLLACVRPSVVRAFAAQSGGFGNYGRAGNCPQMGVPGAFLVGLNDTSFLPEVRTARDTWWRPKNGCGSTTTALNPSPCVVYASCQQDVVSCEFSGVHEVWSNARTVVWDFFSRF